MIDLFKKCLNAEYTHTANGGDYAVHLDGNTLYLLFECSDGKEDWRNNFRFFAIPWKPYKRTKTLWFCHRGFLKVWKSMRDDIERTVEEILTHNENICNITCVGYSHGGALAVFATEDMEYLHGSKYIVSGYGFGAPRVLWGIVPKAVKGRLRSFTTIRNIPDIVTHVPPVFLGFRNAGVLTRIGKSGKYTLIKAHYASAYIESLTIKTQS